MTTQVTITNNNTTAAPIDDGAAAKMTEYVIKPSEAGFYALADEMSAAKITPYILHSKDGTTIPVLLMHDVPTGILDNIYKQAKRQYKCNTCGLQIRDFCKYSSPEGPIGFTSSLITELPEEYDSLDLYKQLMTLQGDAIKSPVNGVKIITNQLYELTTGEYIHWAPQIDIPIIDKLMKKKLNQFQQALDKYLSPITNMIPLLVKQLITNQGGVKGAIVSLQLMITCCKKAAYGDNFLGTINWLLDLMNQLDKLGKTPEKMSPKDRWILYAEFLLNGIIAPDSVGMTCISYHQANNNVLDLLNSARTENAMITMLRNRLAPTNYLRKDPSKPVSERIIEMGKRILGNFTNTVVSKTTLEALPNCVILNHTTRGASGTSVAAAFDKMTFDAKPKNVGFAARCNITKDTSIIRQIKSVQALIDFLSLNPFSTLLLDITCEKPVIIATTTLLHKRDDIADQDDSDDDGDDAYDATGEKNKAVLCVPYVWHYKNSSRASTLYGLAPGYQNVSHILPMWKDTKFDNVYFGIAGATTTVKHDYCCFPSFLRTKYQRTLGTIFEKINSTASLSVPRDPVYGIGSSGIDRDHTLMSPLKMRLNGVDIVITHTH